MSTPAVPPMEAAGLSEPERIIDTFIAPSKTFNDIRRNASWWVPVVLLMIVSIALSVVIVKKVDFKEVVRDSIQNSPRASQFEQMSPEDRERAYEQGATLSRVIVYVVWLFSLVGILLTALMMIGVFNFGFGAKLDYKHCLAISAYGSLPEIVGALLFLIVILSVDPSSFNIQNPLATNIAYFFDPSNGQHYWYRMLRKIDVIRIWSLGLMALGVSKNSKVTFGAAFSAAFGVFLVVALLFSLIG